VIKLYSDYLQPFWCIGIKVLIAGNMVNQGFVTASKLRKEGLDVHLLMEDNPHITADPVFLEPNMKNNYPDWIHFFSKENPRWKFDVITKMKEFDLIHAWVEFPIFALFSGKNFIVNTQGSDFRELYHTKSLKGFLLKIAYKKAKVIIFNQPDYLKKNPKILIKKGVFVPVIWESKNWPTFNSISHKNNFIIFHPTSLNWRIKGNQILIKGFANYLKQHPNSSLIIVKRGNSINDTQKLIETLGITNQVKFINGPLNRIDLAKNYTNADVIADQFIVGSLGTIALESMFYKKPVITYIDKSSHEKTYAEIPPVCNAQNAKEIENRLNKLNDNAFRDNIGKISYDWVHKYHSSDIIVKKIKKIYELVHKKKKTHDILEILKMDDKIFQLK
jgi:glycosyltransferase involved in cell wall biosynthesis